MKHHIPQCDTPTPKPLKCYSRCSPSCTISFLEKVVSCANFHPQFGKIMFITKGPFHDNAKVLGCMVMCKLGIIKVDIQFMNGKIVIEMETRAFWFPWSWDKLPFTAVVNQIFRVPSQYFLSLSTDLCLAAITISIDV